MDPHSFMARAEAQRWLRIAEELLMARDLVGSKTSAIRARESDPRLEAADQILAVTDTLLAADKRVGPGNNQPDWYGILQLVRLTQDTELIAVQYRRLALLLNPHSNLLPYADQAYQLVSEAWSVLSDPISKNLYDNELNFGQIGFNHHHHHQPPPQQQPPPQLQQHNFFSQPNPIGGSSSSSRESERIPVVQEQPFMTRFQQQQQLLPHNFLSETNPIEPIKVSQPQPRPPPPPQQPPQWKQPPEAGSNPRPQQPQDPPPPSQQQQQPQPTPPPPPPPPLQPQQQQQSQEERPPTMPPDDTPDGIDGESPNFWTLCPFCYNMYEYPRLYADCTLRCVNCKRAFQAVVIPPPPEVVEGKEAYFCCWGYFPLAISMPHLPKNKPKASSWAPFSPIYSAGI